MVLPLSTVPTSSYFQLRFPQPNTVCLFKSPSRDFSSNYLFRLSDANPPKVFASTSLSTWWGEEQGHSVVAVLCWGTGLCKHRSYTCVCLRWQISVCWNFLNPSRATTNCVRVGGLQQQRKGPSECVNDWWFFCMQKRCPALQCAWLCICALPHFLQTLAGGSGEYSTPLHF